MPLSMISPGAKPLAPAPCSAPEYHEFDFWLGNWDSFDFATSTKDARIRVKRILDGCVIHENYQSADGHKGEASAFTMRHEESGTKAGSPIAANSSSSKANWSLRTGAFIGKDST
jgi:hypothetical protein